jgi:EmrB/QacA subfamily drug resistance transporter
MASLNVALPSIARSTHATQTQLEWVIDAYSLVFASLLLPAGAIGDKFGRRLALVAGLAVFGVASAVAMTAGGANELIARRAVLGLGAALVMPATLSTITSTFPAEQRTRAVSVWAGVAGGSAVIGLLASGLLLQHWSWRSVFALNVILAVAAIVGTLHFVPESADTDTPRLDVGGAVLAVAGLVALVFSVIEAPEVGWISARTLVGLAVAAVVLAGFVAWELTRQNPMLDPRILRHPRLAAGSLSIFVQFFSFFGYMFIALQYLQIVRGDSPILAAVSVLPMVATMLPVTRAAARLVPRFGARRVCVAGLALIAAGLLILSQLDASSSYWILLAGMIPLGAGMGAAMTPATSAITEALPAARQGVGSALNDLCREVGGALGIAVIGSILDAGYRANLNLPGLPAAVSDKARGSFAVASRLGPAVMTEAQGAFVDGMHVALLAAAIAAGAAATAVAVLLKADR